MGGETRKPGVNLWVDEVLSEYILSHGHGHGHTENSTPETHGNRKAFAVQVRLRMVKASSGLKMSSYKQLANL